jgi:hypothetical protein
MFRKTSGETVNVTYVKKAWLKSQPIFKLKNPGLSSHDPRPGFSTGMEPQSTTSQSTPPPQSRTSKGSKGAKPNQHPLYSPDIASANFFLCPRVKSELAGILLSQHSFKLFSGVVQTITKTNSPTPFGSGWTTVKSLSDWQ